VGNGVVSQGSYDPVTGLFDIGAIPVGGSVTLILEGTVDVGQGGNTIQNITTAATGDQVDPSTVGDDLEESVVINDAADLVTVKTLASGDPTPAEGDTVTFDITVTNNGAAQATNVSLIDQLPAGITLTGVTGIKELTIRQRGSSPSAPSTVVLPRRFNCLVQLMSAKLATQSLT